MLRKLIFAAAALVALPASAQAESVTRAFTYDGVDYTYTTNMTGDVRAVEGIAGNGKRFKLIVRGSRVSGTFNNRPVHFTLSEVKAVKVAAR